MAGTVSASLRQRIAGNPLWYHSMDLGDGVTTAGWFDLRPVVDQLPWPDVTGKRCLDVGTYDGFLAFELERRGAASVVATDISGHEDWDWLPRDRAMGPDYLAEVAGEKGGGFLLAREAFGSKVTRESMSVYDLSPERLGMFDVVVCGSLLLHLRDPFLALERIRGVCSGNFLSAEHIDVWLTAIHPRTPCLRVVGQDGQWAVPNIAGHRRLLRIAGFDLVRVSKPYAIPYGPAHPSRALTAREKARAGLQRTLGMGEGVPMSSALVKPM